MKSAPDNLLSAAASDPALTQICDEIIERLQAGEMVDVVSLALEHPEYAEQLQRLLPALEALVDLGASSAQQATPKNSHGGTSDPAPRALGDYRILREIGRGGMGVVYEAEQRSLNRRVALKVLPMAAALDARQFQRFQLEAQAAACLHHNNIVPVFAVGTEGGVPFYAMQFIEGRSLAQVIVELRRAEGLDPAAPGPHPNPLEDLTTTALARSLIAGGPTRDRATGPGAIAKTDPQPPQPAQDVKPLSASTPASSPRAGTGSSTHTRAYARTVAGLGLQAAEALDHAHTRGILHRDIKPGNLLLDAEGRLWVADFGLAQIQGSPSLTLSGDVLGTLRYMSPEQALGKRVVIDGRTDVYSLGVTLYELLTLRPALDGKDRAEILRKIAGDDPTPLRKLNPAVSHDLETIIHKAMAKEPLERYATAKELSDDLRNYLEARSIRARRPSLRDRTAKWARRHAAFVGAAGAVLALAVVGLVASTVLIAKERAQAVRQRDFARKAVDEMYTQVAEKWFARQPRLTQVQREFLEKALAFYEQFAAEEGDDLEMRLEAARAWLRTGTIQDKLGRPEQAETARRQAIARLEDLVARHPDRAESSAELANALATLGKQYTMDARPVEAEPLLTRAVATYESLVARFPGVRKYRLELAQALGSKGGLRVAQGRWQEAESDVRRGRKILLKLVADAPRDRDCLRSLATRDMDLGSVFHGTRRYREAEEADRRAEERFEMLLAEDPADQDLRLRLAVALKNHALSLEVARRWDDAIASLQRAEGVLQSLVSDFPDVPEYCANLGDCQWNLVLTLRVAGRLGEAIQVGELAVKAGETRVREYPAVPGYRVTLARTLGALAEIHTAFREEPCYDPPRALELARRAVEVAPDDGEGWQSLGWAQYRLGDWSGCIKSLEKQKDYSRVGDFVAVMAYWKLGDHAKAREMFATCDKWLRSYERHYQGDKYPEPPLFRRLRNEAAALLGVAPAQEKAQPKPPD